MGKKTTSSIQISLYLVLALFAVVSGFLLLSSYWITSKQQLSNAQAATIPSDACNINPVNKCSQGVFPINVCQFIPDGSGKTPWNYFTISGKPSMSVQQYGNSGGEPNHIHIESSDGKPFIGGVYYTFNTTPGHKYCASWRWGPNTHDPSRVGVETFAKTVGLDPSGGTNPQAATVGWGNTFSTVARHNDYPPPDVNLDTKAIATGNSMTIFLKAEYKALESSFMQIDMVNVYDEGVATGLTQSTSTPTPQIPTSTPVPAIGPVSKLKFNNNAQRDSTDVQMGVEVADVSNPGEVADIIQYFQGLPIFIKLKHPQNGVINTSQFDALKKAGFMFYISQGDYATLNTFAAAYFQKYPGDTTPLILELDNSSAVDAAQTQTLVNLFPMVKFFASDTAAGNYGDIQTLVNKVPFPPMHAVSYHYSGGSDVDVYGSEFYTANATFFDTSDKGFMVKWPTDSSPNENMMTALSHIDTPNMSSPQSESLRFGLVAIALYDYAQFNGQHGIKYINLGTFSSFRPGAKFVAQYIAELSKRKMRIFWPNSSTGNGDPWQSGVLDPATKPVVGIAADSAADGAAYFLVNGGSSPRTIELVYPSGISNPTMTFASTIKGKQTNITLPNAQFNLDSYESVVLLTNGLSSNPALPTQPGSTATPTLPPAKNAVNAMLEKIDPTLPISCDTQNGTINFLNTPVDIRYTVTANPSFLLEKARIYIGKADFSPWTTCPSGSSIKSPTIIGKPTSSKQWCVIEDVNLGSVTAAQGVFSFTPDQEGDFYVVINAKEPDVPRSCSGNPQCNINSGTFIGGTIKCDARNEWYDCGPHDSFLLKVRKPPAQCTIPATIQQTMSSTIPPESSVHIETTGPFCTQTAIKFNRLARSPSGDMIGNSDLIVSLLDGSGKPSTWTCPAGTKNVGSDGKWCAIESTSLVNKPFFDQTVTWQAPSPGTYAAAVVANNNTNQIQCSGNPECSFNGGGIDCKTQTPKLQDCGPNDFTIFTVNALCGNTQTTYSTFTIENNSQNSCSVVNSKIDLTVKGTAAPGKTLEKADIYVGKADLSAWLLGCPTGTVSATANHIWCKVSEINFAAAKTGSFPVSFIPEQADTYVFAVNGKETGNANQCTGSHQCSFNGGSNDCASQAWYDCAQNSISPHDSVQVKVANNANCAPAKTTTPATCTSVVNKGDPNVKLDVIIIPQLYNDITKFKRDAQFAISDLQSANLGTLIDKFNFWTLDDITKKFDVSPACANDFGPCAFDRVAAYNAMRDCNGDVFLMLVDIPESNNQIRAGFASAGFYGGVVFSPYIYASAHELSHAIADTDDEYDGGKVDNGENNPAYNCSTVPSSSTTQSCPKWDADKLAGTQCIPGCAYKNWYRSTPKSIMTGGRDQITDHYFNPPCIKMWENALKKFQ